MVTDTAAAVAGNIRPNFAAMECVLGDRIGHGYRLDRPPLVTRWKKRLEARPRRRAGSPESSRRRISPNAVQGGHSGRASVAAGGRGACRSSSGCGPGREPARRRCVARQAFEARPTARNHRSPQSPGPNRSTLNGSGNPMDKMTEVIHIVTNGMKPRLAACATRTTSGMRGRCST